MKGGSLCTGAAGLDLGLSAVLDVEWVWHAENDRDASLVLERWFPAVPNLGDLEAVDWEQVEQVELVAAGFPCPDFSVAGTRRGMAGDRGQVWFLVVRALRALRPRLVVLENVPGIRTAPGMDVDAGESALGVVLSDLAALGYDAVWSGLRAADIGAPHGRDRWFCVASLADSVGAGVDADGRVRGGGSGAPRPERPAPPAVASGPSVDGAEDALADGGRAAADAEGERRQGLGREPGDEPAAGRAGPARDRRSAADAERLAGPETGERDGGSGAGGVARARGIAGEAVDRIAGRARGGDEAAADPDRERCGGVREPQPGGVEGARRRVTDGRDAVRQLGDAEAAADAAGGGRSGWQAGDGRDGQGGEAPLGPEGDAAAPDGGLDARGDFGDAVHGDGGGAEAAADAGREPGEPGGGRRAARGAHARGGAQERDGGGLARPTEPGEDAAAADAAHRSGERERPRPEPRGGGEDAAADAEGGDEPVGTVGDGREPAMVGTVARAGGGAGAGDPPEGVRELGGGAGEVAWGVYESAVRRWEHALGRPAPRPTDDRGRLEPRFVEWMLGFPEGWVDDVPDLARTAKLRILGNAVQVQCGEVVAAWLVQLVDAGLLPYPEAA